MNTEPYTWVEASGMRVALWQHHPVAQMVPRCPNPLLLDHPILLSTARSFASLAPTSLNTKITHQHVSSNRNNFTPKPTHEFWFYLIFITKSQKHILCKYIVNSCVEKFSLETTIFSSSWKFSPKIQQFSFFPQVFLRSFAAISAAFFRSLMIWKSIEYLRL